MNTLNEIVDYCLEPEVVGALLLTGEWGCGKTYLIDHLLPEKLKNEAGKSIAIVLRVSLFGMTKAEEINKNVKCLWINAYCSELEEKSDCTKKAKQVGKKIIQKGREVVSSLEFLPDWIQGLGTTDWESFVKIENTLGKKPVVIVFDDLERCRMDTVDVLGCINDYCENQKFHTIIVANQEKITKINNPSHIKASIDVSDLENKQKNNSKKYELDFSVPNKDAPGQLSYEEIKEKIIQRTVQYIPDYESIVNTVIYGMKYENQKYKEFVIANTTGMLELFAPDRVNIASQNIEDDNIFETVKKVQSHEHPHNIRSLKCAICDFYRIYKILNENQISNLDRWLFSFSSYVIAYKAGIAKEGYYGTLITDQIVKKIFPAYDDNYLLNSAKKWILHGIWDEDELKYEVERLLIKQEAASPCDLVRTRRIIDLEESVADAGFPEVLHMAYNGELTLDEYVQFILNCSWMRMYNYQPSEKINWELIRDGIRKTEAECPTADCGRHQSQFKICNYTSPTAQCCM
ncbi:MAG: P-loop NTPase fold protein [Lachnospiraceae bacterium]|nr:P-loop NTPase fold protein [Lachnospiraceae bacterium]